MNRFICIVCAGILVLFSVGCDEAFSPKGPHTPQVVVYSILNPKEGRQFVRLSVTYDVEGFDPLTRSVDESISGAIVTVTQGTQTLTFRDTIVAREDTSRYKTPVAAYVADPFLLQPGSSVSLSINTPKHGILTAETRIPSRGYISVTNAYVLRTLGSLDPRIVVLIQIAPQARGYYLRYYIVYDVTQNNTVRRERRAFPQSVIIYASTNRYDFVYPKLERRSAEPFLQNLHTETVIIDQLGYQMVLEDIIEQYGADNLRFQHVLFELIQVDPPLYNYYNIVNGFQDEFSIRTDLPDYTNIRGGIGVFGSFTVDTLLVSLPSRF
ncbi:MAG TPA: DUF4249 family protein [Bacteroidota bacterium]|nr:DUF4249 family protein [Bacteroidota bacterium]